ncbi:MAG: hypothetical protein D6731_11990 [Planctomycetota bacterium]|nr:MAG: hypothetical protein D6731_11990 [Planctomycetota bacterium]
MNARAPRPRSLTLVEVAVASGILALLLAACMSLLVSTQAAGWYTAASFELSEEARRALSEIRRDLRQSGWEYSDQNPADLWAGNMIEVPKPTDAAPGAFGTRSTSRVSTDALPADGVLLRFRTRVAFGAGPGPGPAALWDWSNDGVPNPTDPTPLYVVYQAVADGVYRNVPGGTLPRYKLVRGYGPLGAEVPQGVVINNLERATFVREDWDTVLVQLEFLLPHPTGQGSSPPPPLRRKILERVQAMNPSGK